MAEQPQLLLRFTPHEPRRHSASGWTAERQVAFIAALARTGVVAHAARSVGMSPRSAYSLRATVKRRYSNWADVPLTPEQLAPLGPGYIYSFAAAWDLAVARGLKAHIEEAPSAALEERVPIIRRGQIIGWQTRLNIRLALAALGAFRRYNAGPSFDHDHRTAERIALAHEKFETLLRLGPIDWDAATPPAETIEERRARQRAERRKDRLYGEAQAGLRDPYGPVDRPPRTLAKQEADLRRYGWRGARAGWDADTLAAEDRARDAALAGYAGPGLAAPGIADPPRVRLI